MDAVDLALLSYLGVNGRAFGQVFDDIDLRDLIRASYLKKQKSLNDDELALKIEKGEKFRMPLREFQEQGGQILGLKGEADLGGLARAPRPPLCAYLRGNAALLTASPKVAIIGTRSPSQRGEMRAENLARSLSRNGVVVVSGGAIGIDSAAHRGAVSEGCETLAVLGDPLRTKGDERPSRLRKLIDSNLLTTATLFGPWVRPAPALFVARNQFVAALADAVVIVEGKLKSGTLHTAKYAQEMGVPVWAIPGDLDNEMASAGNFLLERGLAKALVGVEYFVSTLKKQPEATSATLELPLKEKNAKPHCSKLDLYGAQKDLYDLIRQNEGSMTLDEIAEKCETPVSALQQELLMLELLGALRKQGMQFELI